MTFECLKDSRATTKHRTPDYMQSYLSYPWWKMKNYPPDSSLLLPVPVLATFEKTDQQIQAQVFLRRKVLPPFDRIVWPEPTLVTLK